MRRPVRRADREAAQSYPLFQRPTGLAVGLAQERLRAGSDGRLAPYYLGPPLTSGRVPEAIRRFIRSVIRSRLESTHSWLAIPQSTPDSPSRSSSRPCSSAGASATSSTSRSAAARARRRFVFYEGPPTANGRPGSHHVLARVFKDVFPRYKTMRGHLVPRKGGWDCHGLPVELEVEKELGFTSKAGHRALRRRRVQRQVPRVGAALHRRVERADRADRLLDRHRRRLLHARQRVRRVGLVVAQAGLGEGPADGGPQGRARTAPRDGTALSSHEVALGYRDVVDPSRVRALPAARTSPSVSLLAWTTMPWTLVPHAAIAVDPT